MARSECAHVVCVGGLLDRFVLRLAVVSGPLNLDDVRWCVRSGHMNLIGPPTSSSL